MNLCKNLIKSALAVSAFIVGCSDDSSTGSNISDGVSLKLARCQAIDENDYELQEDLDDANQYIPKILDAFSKGNLENAKKFSARSLSKFDFVLAKYPSNCEAQAGVAISKLANIVGSKEIQEFVDSLGSVKNTLDSKNLYNNNLNDLTPFALMKTIAFVKDENHKDLVTIAQSAIEKALPVIDTSIAYLKNIASDSNFTLHYNEDYLTIVNSDINMLLSSMYLLKATMVVAYSIDISPITDDEIIKVFNLPEYYEGHTQDLSDIDSLITYFERNSFITRIYPDKKSDYKSVPTLLDEAVNYAIKGMEQKLSQARFGEEAQEGNIYIVGNDEDSDIRFEDYKAVLDSVKHFANGLHGPVEVNIPGFAKFKVDLSKFFEITDGFVQYLPYHKLNLTPEWYKAKATDKWLLATSDVDNGEYYIYNNGVFSYYQIDAKFSKRYTFAFNEIFASLIKQYEKFSNKQYKFEVHIDRDFVFNGKYEEKGELGLINSLYDDYYDDYYNAVESAIYFKVKLDGCKYSFYHPDSIYNEPNNVTDFAPVGGTLSSDDCIEQKGYVFFRKSRPANLITFTDANGTPTFTLEKFLDEYNKIDNPDDYGETSKTKVDLFKEAIIFPDITIGGTFPGMTADKFWKLMQSLYDF